MSNTLPPIPLKLRMLLSLVKLFRFDGSKPLNKTRGMTNYFMGMCNRRFGIKFPDFFSEKTISFTAKEGHEIKLRVFTPYKTDKLLPVWIYYHGGGFAHGHYKARPRFCQAIATYADCIVVSVRYRLTPEFPFPAGINDCYEALVWISENAEKFGGDKTKIAIGGESAGGNISAVLPQMARDKNGPKILHQTLLYPPVDFANSYPSIEKFGDDYIVDKAYHMNIVNSYLPKGADRKNPYCSPLFGNLKGLPPALVITAGYDSLVDEGDLYVEKLKQAGVPVVHKRYDNMIHDFTMIMPRYLAEARDSIELTAREAKKAFASS